MGGGSSGVSTKCISRNKSAAALALGAAEALSKLTVVSYATTLTAGLTAWSTQNNVVLTKTGPVNVATEYKNLLNTAVSTANTAITTAGTAKTNATGPKDTNNAATATKLTDLTNKQTTIANALAAKNSASTAWTV